MRWNQTMENLADHYVRQAIGVPQDQPTPPVRSFSLLSCQKKSVNVYSSSQYITVHARHSDFFYGCGDIPPLECFASVSTMARLVGEVRTELAERKNVHVRHVFMTSDETDPGWWSEVAAQGWLRLDHERTTREQGPWSAFPPFSVLSSP